MPYDPNFIPNLVVPLPTLLATTLVQSFDNGRVFPRTNFSFVFNQQRSLAVYAAHNIDGGNRVGGIPSMGFIYDPEPLLKPNNQAQVGNARGYDDNPWDKGHLARRVALHWPNEATALVAEREAAYYTNAIPQHQRMNRGPWARVENWILNLADDNNRRACIFTGPVFTENDPTIQNSPNSLPVRIPAGYWKLGAIPHENALCVVAFLMWQCDVDTGGPLPFDPVLEQVRVTTVEYLAGLAFGQAIRDADPLRFTQAGAACVVNSEMDLVLPRG